MGVEMRNKITISVSVPLFNRLDLFKKTVNSVFAQAEPPDEFIIVDNGSTDGSYEYALTLKGKGVKVYRNKTNIGMIGNWNETIKRSNSEFVVSLHSDDLLMPDYIKTWKEKINKLNNKSDIGAFFSGGYIIDGEDRVKAVYQPFKKDMLLKPPTTITYMWNNFHFHLSVTGWTLYNRSIMQKVGYFTSNYNIAAENEMAMKIFPSYPVFYSSALEFAFRRHGLQGFDKKVVQFSLNQEVKNAQDALKVYYDYEINKKVIASFSLKERREGLFVKLPTSFFIAQALAFLVFLDFKHAKAYFNIFRTELNLPIFSFQTLKLFVVWITRLVKTYISNVQIQLRMGRKPILDYFRV